MKSLPLIPGVPAVEMLTAGQLKVLLLITLRSQRRTVTTLRYISERMGWSGPHYAAVVVKKLIAMGLVEYGGRTTKGHRSVSVTLVSRCRIESLSELSEKGSHAS